VINAYIMASEVTRLIRGRRDGGGENEALVGGDVNVRRRPLPA